MRGRQKASTADQKRVGQVSDFLTLGFRDYLAARVLLNTRLPLQGSALASTCVEKYFKAILAFHGNARRGHLCSSLVRAVANVDRGLMSSLSPSFLVLLERCYQRRYQDGIGPGYNLSISAREVLAELDFTVAHVESKLTLSRQDGRLLGRYRELAAQRDPRLFANNHVLAKQSREEFLAAPDFVYEIRLTEERGLIEAEYSIRSSPTDRDFLRAGLAPIPAGAGPVVSYQLALGKKGNLFTPEGGDSPPVPAKGEG